MTIDLSCSTYIQYNVDDISQNLLQTFHGNFSIKIYNKSKVYIYLYLDILLIQSQLKPWSGEVSFKDETVAMYVHAYVTFWPHTQNGRCWIPFSHLAGRKAHSEGRVTISTTDDLGLIGVCLKNATPSSLGRGLSLTDRPLSLRDNQ